MTPLFLSPEKRSWKQKKNVYWKQQVVTSKQIQILVQHIKYSDFKLYLHVFTYHSIYKNCSQPKLISWKPREKILDFRTVSCLAQQGTSWLWNLKIVYLEVLIFSDLLIFCRIVFCFATKPWKWQKSLVTRMIFKHCFIFVKYCATPLFINSLNSYNHFAIFSSPEL